MLKHASQASPNVIAPVTTLRIREHFSGINPHIRIAGRIWIWISVRLPRCRGTALHRHSVSLFRFPFAISALIFQAEWINPIDGIIRDIPIKIQSTLLAEWIAADPTEGIE
jgi:hypothetical protein